MVANLIAVSKLRSTLGRNMPPYIANVVTNSIGVSRALVGVGFGVVFVPGRSRAEVC